VNGILHLVVRPLVGLLYAGEELRNGEALRNGETRVQRRIGGVQPDYLLEGGTLLSVFRLQHRQWQLGAWV